MRKVSWNGTLRNRVHVQAAVKTDFFTRARLNEDEAAQIGIADNGITAVSALALSFKGEDYAGAVQLAASLWDDSHIPGFARAEFGPLVMAGSAEHARRLGTSLLADEPDAMDKIYESFGGFAFAICIRMLRNRSDAEDACQCVFTKLWHRRHQIKDPAGLRQLLAVMARNQCFDELRRRSRGSRETPDYAEGEDEAPSNDAGEEMSLPMTEAAQMLDADVSLMRKCIENLPDDLKRIVELHLLDLSLTEIAKAIRMTKDKVRHRLDDGVKQLKTCLLGSEKINERQISP
jgi:RNA polymerase sigma-70 factor (ECF subfamily)